MSTRKCEICGCKFSSSSYESHISEGHVSKILECLYLGSCLAARDIEELKRNDISVVINIAAELDNLSDTDMGDLIEPPDNIERYSFPIRDVSEENITPLFDQVCELIHTKRRNEARGVLVHCVMGISRSASIILAYLMRYRHMSLRAAYFYVKGIRPVISPNPGFIGQLQKLELLLVQKGEIKPYWQDQVDYDLGHSTLSFEDVCPSYDT